jgi:NAD(P) transhydrogenase subunit alpha|tara:strand:- start:41 stop:1165 length:1125 start_codon:yes stop_codon:yes gene_type:complete
MKICIPKEDSNELRTAISPEIVKKLSGSGHEIFIETNAGSGSNFDDEIFIEAGAKIYNDNAQLNTADFIFRVNAPSENEVALYKENSILIASLNPYNNSEIIKKLETQKTISFAMELMPRITRAQSMDVLSSQSNLAGYQAVIEASHIFNKAMPMMMTAAGTIAPAKVMVFGAGVAGLQAIATAKRLGAIVSATDVRMAAKEQVESLGGKFVMVETEEDQDAETSGGYAKEMSEEFKVKQAELISKTISSQDIVICTALIPGKKAPTLITEEHVKSMKPGSVIIDLAAENGGNCVSTKLGETAVVDGVSIYGASNITSSISQDASALYSKNLFNFFNLLVNQESNQVDIDWEDEIVVNTLITKDGKIIKEEFMK